MAWSRFQSKGAQAAAAASLAVTYTSNLSNGTKLIAAVAVFGNATSTVKDGAANSFTKITSAFFNNVGSNGELSLWAIDTPAGDVGTAPTITATFSGTGPGGIVIQEVSGLVTGSTAAAMTDSAAGTSTGTTSGAANQNLGSPAYASTAPSEYLVACYGDSGNGNNMAAPTGFTLDANVINASSDADCCLAYGNSWGGNEAGGFTVVSGLGSVYAQVLCAFQLPLPPSTAQQPATPGQWW